ncbi:molybdate ABC transporter ATP-binding protein ModF [Conservatibacter flavescens]|uniref:Molybdate ABC transporter ATP-binding protein ModF n=1 Tax=Conservatibacter flavescens TaxID=28161 RepID=A0A2M8S557_9PAST|nr:molybdate ABC transporter ATP-binding protein ModF [Conservatibacter flavescens]PJG86274.1 molybdate ABC transporter ATP-binding protein ModF [Conservatibacter flavescens]
MTELSTYQAQFQRHSLPNLYIPQLTIRKHDYWVVVGYNGSGKSALSLALQNKLSLISGEYTNTFQKITALSFEKQQHILEQTFRDRNNDESPDNFGLTARQLILKAHNDPQLCDEYAEKLNISHLLHRPFMQLSTGESRKVLLCQILVSQPDLLILDEPFEGLDQQSVIQWQQLFSTLLPQMALVLIINRLNDLPQQATHIALLDQGEVLLAGSRHELEQQSIFQQLCYAEQAINTPLPDCAMPKIHLPNDQAVFELQNVTIQYGEHKILDNLNWTVKPNQHWWIKGPNGAGKSTLLSVLTGDHPQSYANHVILFGQQRGSGETIWEIKQKIGYISSQLHMDYRINCSALDVILSGFFDSIGIYQQVPDALRLKAKEWISRINLTALANKPFRSLSWGQQRLLLITRAMVKYPPVLILDEPLQGLDGLNRKLVLNFIDQLVNHSQTQLLFVSHQDLDAPSCITHQLEFVKQVDKYHYRISAV